jgi:hypothetical protein
MRRQAGHFALTGLMLAIALQAGAVSTAVTAVDTAGDCDPLVVPTTVDELGFAPAFPVGERLGTFIPTVQRKIACALTDNVPQQNAIVSIVNQQSVAYTDVWYVAEPETLLSNADGLINGMLAFKIDRVGSNVTLDFESGAADGIFSPGERWTFIIQDYVNTLGLPSNAFTEIGVPSSVVLGKTSSGSIIAVPEPATAALIALGVVALASARRATRR